MSGGRLVQRDQQPIPLQSRTQIVVDYDPKCYSRFSKQATQNSNGKSYYLSEHGVGDPRDYDIKKDLITVVANGSKFGFQTTNARLYTSKHKSPLDFIGEYTVLGAADNNINLGSTDQHQNNVIVDGDSVCRNTSNCFIRTGDHLVALPASNKGNNNDYSLCRNMPGISRTMMVFCVRPLDKAVMQDISVSGLQSYLENVQVEDDSRCLTPCYNQRVKELAVSEYKSAIYKFFNVFKKLNELLENQNNGEEDDENKKHTFKFVWEDVQPVLLWDARIQSETQRKISTLFANCHNNEDACYLSFDELLKNVGDNELTHDERKQAKQIHNKFKKINISDKSHLIKRVLDVTNVEADNPFESEYAREWSKDIFSKNDDFDSDIGYYTQNNMDIIYRRQSALSLALSKCYIGRATGNSSPGQLVTYIRNSPLVLNDSL